MSDFKIYEDIKDAFKYKIEFKNNLLYFNDNILKLIDNKILDFISDDLDGLTNKISKFYDDIKFPNYDDCQDYASLYDKGVRNLFTKKIDDELNYGINILELGCGTGQLSLFLARGNRNIFAVDISNGSLILGDRFKRKNNIKNVFFMKMDVFDLKFKENFFDFTISNGVLHHTKDSRKAFNSLVEVTKPGGLIVIGLYHKYGRFFTKVKQKMSKLIGKKIFLLDKTSLKIKSKKKRDAWVTDQFFNPHETLHLPSEIMQWFEEEKVEFLNLIPHLDDASFPLFQPREKPKLSKLNEFLMMFDRNQIQEGGFFVIIGRKKQI